MHSMSGSEAREKLYRLLDETVSHHEPVLITGPRSNAVLVAEEDWNAMQETLHLLSVPGMRESIVEGLATPADHLPVDFRSRRIGAARRTSGLERECRIDG